MVGGVPLWAALTAFALVALSALLVIAKIHKSKPPLPLISLLGLGLSISIGIRLIPGSAEFLESANTGSPLAGLLGHPTEMGVLHFAPGEAARKILHILTLTLAATSAQLLCARRSETQTVLVRWILLGGLFVVGIGYFDLAFDLQKVAGLYTPIYVGRTAPFFSTLINTNHLGAYLVFITGMAVGVAVTPTDPREGGAAFLLAVASICGMVLTLSKGSIAAAAMLGIFLFLLAFYRRRLRARAQKWSVTNREFAIFCLIGAFFGATVFILGNTLTEEFNLGGDLAVHAIKNKLELLSGGMWVIHNFPWTGVGAGGFPDAVTSYQAPGPDSLWTHVENLPLQIFVDHGLPLGILLLLVSVFLFAAIARNSMQDFKSAIFLGALGSLFFQNLFDFNLYFVGTGLPMAATVGFLSARSPILETRKMRFGIITVANLVFALALVPSTIANERTDVGKRMRAASVHATSIDDTIQADLNLYPHEGNLIAFGGKIIERTQGLEAALPWYRAARNESPVRYVSAILSASAFQRAGRAEEAARDYRDICLLKPSDLNLQMRWSRLMLKLPHGRQVTKHLAKLHLDCTKVVITQLRGANQWAAMRELSEIALQLNPKSFALRFFRGEAAYVTGDKATANLDAAILMGNDPDRPEGMMLEATLRMKDEPKVAMVLFEQAVNRAEKWSETIRTTGKGPWELAARRWAEMAIRVQDEESLIRALQILRTRYGRIDYAHLMKGQFAMASGDLETAEREFSRVRARVMAKPRLKLQYLKALIGTHRETSARALCSREDRWPNHMVGDVRAACAKLNPRK